MLASESGAASVVEVLVQRGADLSAIDSQGHNVGHYANVSGHQEVRAALAAALSRQQIPGTGHTHRKWTEGEFRVSNFVCGEQ